MVKHTGGLSKEEFVRDAIRFRLTWLKGDNQCLEIPRDQFEKLNEALEEMDMPFHSAEQLINSQINEILKKYEEYKKSKRK
jgi:hypothetical protein